MRNIKSYKIFESKEDLLTIAKEVFDIDDFNIKSEIDFVRNSKVNYSVSHGEISGICIKLCNKENPFDNKSIKFEDYEKIYPLLSSRINYLFDTDQIFRIRCIYIPHGQGSNNTYVESNKLLSPDVLKNKIRSKSKSDFEFMGKVIKYDDTGFDRIDIIVRK